MTSDSPPGAAASHNRACCIRASGSPPWGPGRELSAAAGSSPSEGRRTIGPMSVLRTIAATHLLSTADRRLLGLGTRKRVPTADRSIHTPVLVGLEQLALAQGDVVPGRVAAVLSLPDGDDNASAEAHLTLNPLNLEPVVKAQSGGQRLVLASAKCPAPAGMNVLVDVMLDYGWRLLAGSKPHLQAVRWPRLLAYLSGGSGGLPILAPAALWDQALQSVLHSATARAQVSALRL